MLLLRPEFPSTELLTYTFPKAATDSPTVTLRVTPPDALSTARCREWILELLEFNLVSRPWQGRDQESKWLG